MLPTVTVVLFIEIEAAGVLDAISGLDTEPLMVGQLIAQAFDPTCTQVLAEFL